MKVVAGLEIVSSRDIGLDDSEVLIQPDGNFIYVDAIVKAKRKYSEHSVRIAQSECFAVLWKDEAGECLMTECELRGACQEAYIIANNPSEIVEETQNVVRSTRKIKEEKAKHRKLRKGPLQERNKWQGTGKYTRQGYTQLGRPVDTALRYLIDGLGNPPTLPKGWHHVHFDEHYKKLGRLLISQSASYTSVMIDGKVVLRFWTNSNYSSLIDFSTEIYAIMQVFKKVGQIVSVTDGNRKKLFPCEYRTSLGFGGSLHEELLRGIGRQIQMMI